MELREFGPTKRKVPVIGQGTWHSGNEDPAPRAFDRKRGGGRSSLDRFRNCQDRRGIPARASPSEAAHVVN